MSVVSASRTQKREKSSSNTHKTAHASAEEIRLAQIISKSGPEDDLEISKHVAQVVEVTGVTEENARIALYDCNNDPNRAIDKLLESDSIEQTNEWETAGRKKNKQNLVRGVDSFEEDSKEDFTPLGENYKPTAKGRGRGKTLKGRGRTNDADRPTGNENKPNYEHKDKSSRDRRGRGRGFGRGGRRGGGPPRRYGRNSHSRGNDYSNDRFTNGKSDLPEKFGTFTNSNSSSHTQPTERWDSEEKWGDIEVGTWSNGDSHKQTQKQNDPVSEAWGTEELWNDDLLETQVFQSQSAQITSSLPTQSNHVASQGTAPQMGERIDLGALFKKNSSESDSRYSQQADSLIGQSGMVYNNSASQHSTPSVIQQLQQQGQSNSLFSDSKMVNDKVESKSRLFGAYDRQNVSSSSGNPAEMGAFNSRTSDPSYSSYTDNLMAEVSEGSNSLLGSFGEQFKSPGEQNMHLGQMSDLSKSTFSSLSQQSEQPGPVSSTSNYHNFSQAQQREATEAVKASLGLPATGDSDQMQASDSHAGPTSITHSDNIGQNTLSFGAPQPARIKHTRKKMSTLSSKIPASAVEMPGAGGGNFHDLSNFDLQFGIDDSLPTVTTKMNGAMLDAGLPSTQASLYNSNVMTSPASLINHMTSGNLEEASLFPTPLASQTQQVRSQVDAGSNPSDSSGSVNSQRFSESLKTTPSTLRGPPGITHPQSLSSATSAGSNLGVLTASTQQSSDLSSTSYASERMVAGGKMPLGNLSHEAPNETPQSSINSYYSSQSFNPQPQNMSQEHASSAGRSLRSPAPSSQKSHTVTPSKDANTSASTSMSSLASGLVQAHIAPHVGGTPTKIQTTSSAPINILGSSDSSGAIGGSGGYGSMSMGYSTTTAVSSQSSTPVAASPGKHLTSNDMYTSAGLSSSIHHNHQTSAAASIASSSLNSGLASSVLSLSNTATTKSSSLSSGGSKAGPPNLTLGVPPMLPNQYGIPMAPGLMTAYTPEALYSYADPLVAVQSRVPQMPNYYDMYSSNNLSNASSSNRESSTTSSSQGKFGRGEPSSPTSLIGVVNSGATNLAQQQLSSGQHGTQLKVSQSGAHQAQQFMNLPAATPAYAGYSGLYYNAFQYPPTMFAAAATAVPSGKHQGNTTTAFQQLGSAFANAYSSSSINVSSASNIHDLQSQGFSKNHVPTYDKQAAFHHHTNTPPPFNIQTLTAAMAAANTGAAAGAGPGMNPYTQAPFMTVLPTHQHSQIHLHLPQHGDAGQSAGSQRSQDSNPLAKSANKGPFGNTGTQYWGN